MLRPLEAAGLPKKPERAARAPNASAGHLGFRVHRAGLYRITLSGEAWIDVIQSETYLKPAGFTGISDCATVRKSVKFRLERGPVLLQLSGPQADRIAVAITPDR